MTKKVIIIGGEGNGGVVAACIDDMRSRYNDTRWEVAGFLNDYEEKSICGYPVLGKCSAVARFLKEDFYFSFAIHPIEHGMVRVDLFESLGIPDDRLATIVHPSAFVSNNAVIGPGSFVMANCYIGPQTTLEKSVFVMANCVVGHNDYIAAFCHISAGAVISSYVKMGYASDICLAASVLEKVSIGNCSVIGAKALLTKNVGDSELYIGAPAKLHRKIEYKEYHVRED